MVLRFLFWFAWLGVACGVPTGQVHASPAQTTPVVVVLHNGFVSSEKFSQLQPIAQNEGVQLRHLDVDRARSVDWERALHDAALIVLDVPRPNDRAAVVQAWEERRPTHRPAIPHVVVGGGRPAFEGMAPQPASVLAALYAAGGQQNFVRFFKLAQALASGRAPDPAWLAAPERLPSTGFYHPQAPQAFETLTTYLTWHQAYMDAQKGRRAGEGQSRMGAPADLPSSSDRAVGVSRKGIVAFLVHQGAVGDLLTRELDVLVARSEAAGLRPVVFWMDGAQPGGLAQVLGQDRVDVLVNMTHMQDGAARSRDFLALDVPVIQTLRFREGQTADWADAPSGVSPRTTAVFLAGPEGWGVSDPIVLSASTSGVASPLPAQLDALIAKLQRLVALRHTRATDKRLALMFWNYPAGEKNLGASHLNIPRSVQSIQQALANEGYAVGEPFAEADLIARAQRMLGALYGQVSFDALLEEDLAALYPVAEYERWLARLPSERRTELRHGGVPSRHRAVRQIDGQAYFVIPRWKAGHLLVMPQMPRHAGPEQHYHDTATAPDHLYLAAYLYLQDHYQADALIHLGTHGTQEWLPGKDRGLAATDYPWLALGSLPVFYPYIQDNVGEAIQAKRRGRAVTISHQTPPFAPAGLYDELRDIHHLIHEYEQLDEGGVRTRVAEQIRSVAAASHLHDDLGWTMTRAQQDFDGFLLALHGHLHELARRAMPLGLHTFGQPADQVHRISTLMQQLGAPLQSALGLDDEAMMVSDEQVSAKHPAHAAIVRLLDAPDVSSLPDEWQTLAERARALDGHLRDTQENESLLAGLAGRFVAPGSGGDPIRDPDVPSGRNLYAFEAEKVPARAAYRTAEVAYAQLIEQFKRTHAGQWPQKLAFSLWASETVRHLGVTEAQVLHALGLRPQWDASGRVTALHIIPAAELGRPRSDVVIQATGVYRDQFDSFMRLLDQAMQQLAALDEPGNPVAANTTRVASVLQSQGVPAGQAQALARARIFSQAPGAYGTGVPELALRSDQWDDDAVLAQQFLASSRFAYSGAQWGQSPDGVNVLAEQLRGTQAAVMSRASSLHGVLSTDHPFEFLGGLSAAVRELDGAAPELLVSDLRQGAPRTISLAGFLSEEMRTRYLNPQWIEGMQREGYAGTLEVLKATNNLFGWQAVDSNTVREDQWQALFDTYVADTRELGTEAWFESHHPTAQAQVIERMAEAIRKGYWDASDATRQTLAARFEALSREHGVDSGAPATRQFIASMGASAPGFGLDGPAADAVDPATPTPPAGNTSSGAPDGAADVSAPATGSRPAHAEPMPDPTPDAPAREMVQGQVMQPVTSPPDPPDPRQAWVLAALICLVLAGGMWQAVCTPRTRFGRGVNSL